MVILCFANRALHRVQTVQTGDSRVFPRILPETRAVPGFQLLS